MSFPAERALNEFDKFETSLFQLKKNVDKKDALLYTPAVLVLFRRKH